MNKVRVLFLAATPDDQAKINLDNEHRAIVAAIRSAKHGRAFEIISESAVRLSDFQHALEEHRPDVLHFSGHGNDSGDLLFEDDAGKSQAVSVDALKTVLSVLNDNIQVVVLNACHSEAAAGALVSHTDIAVGMFSEIGDQAAIAFAASFYLSLGYGRSIKDAFTVAEGKLMGLKWPKHKMPTLHSRPGLDASQVCLVGETCEAHTKVIEASDRRLWPLVTLAITLAVVFLVSTVGTITSATTDESIPNPRFHTHPAYVGETRRVPLGRDFVINLVDVHGDMEVRWETNRGSISSNGTAAKYTPPESTGPDTIVAFATVGQNTREAQFSFTIYEGMK